MKLLKKLVISILLSYFLILNLLVSPAAALAQKGAGSSGTGAGPAGASNNPPKTSATTPQWYNQSFGDWFAKVYDPKNGSEIFGERYTAAQVQWVVYGLLSFILNSAIGTKGSAIVSCMFSTGAGAVTGGQSSQSSNSCLSNLVSFLTSDASVKVPAPREEKSLLSLVFATDRPISGIGYVKQKLDDFHLIPVAHAQTVGFGFTALQPIQNIWRGVRDISYGLFVIAAIVLAFMIMFRVKISPQVVITVQSAIPKIIIALVLVTFSYAIAGFLIDLMYVVIGLISLAFAPFTGPTFAGFTISVTPAQVFQFITQGTTTMLNANLGIILLGALYIAGFTLAFISLLLYHIGIVGAAIGYGIGAVVVPIIGPIVAPLLPFIGMLLVMFLVIVIIWYFFKTIFSLLKAFAQIILLTIFAPLQIAAGVVIPSLGFGTWIKSFVSNLAVFVVTGVLLLFSFIFLAQGWSVGFSEFGLNANPILQIIFGQTGAAIFNPSSGSASWPPLLGGGNSASAVGLLLLGVSFVIFTLVPKANELVQSIISGKPFAYGSAIAEAAGAGWGKTFGPVWEGYNRARYAGTQGDIITQILAATNQLQERIGFRNPTAQKSPKA